jgi:hypothetical protein
VSPLAAARAVLPAWLPFVPLLALPLGFAAGWLARKRTRLAGVMVSSVAGALVAPLGGPFSLLGPGAAGFLGSAAALAAYALGRRQTPPPPPGGIAGRVALVASSVLVLVAAEVGRPRAVAAVSRRSPLAAVALTGGAPGPLSDLARVLSAGPRAAEATPLYRGAFALDGRPGHLADAAFVESHGGRCEAAKALAAEALAAASRAGTPEWDRHLATRARSVAGSCGKAGPEHDED